MIKNLARAILRKLDWRTQQHLLEFHARVLRSSRSWTRRDGDPRFDYSIREVRATAKHNSPTLVVDRLLRYQRALGHDIDFAGRSVLELGAGPVLGWALTGLALGAQRYTVLDPSFNADVIDAMAPYFNDQRRWLALAFGAVASPRELLDSDRLQIVRAPGASSGVPDASVNLILSNSVIEHVLDVDELVAELDRVSAPGGVQYHFVDFSDHRAQVDRFTALYGHHPDEIRALYKQRGLHVNMLRASDIEAAFAQRFAVERTVFLANANQPSVRAPAAWWADHYQRDDLAIEVAAFKLTKPTLKKTRRTAGLSTSSAHSS
jgi:SAM-dependent methyltransferase